MLFLVILIGIAIFAVLIAGVTVFHIVFNRAASVQFALGAPHNRIDAVGAVVDVAPVVAAARRVELVNDTGRQLVAWRYDSSAAIGNRWVIVQHGYRETHADVLDRAAALGQRGYHVLMPDAQGSGASSGRYIQMGYGDRLDLLAWINALTAQIPDAEITMMGTSMGASAVMFLAGETLPSNVIALIADSGYTSVRAELDYQVRQFIHSRIVVAMVLATVALLVRLRLGWSLRAADARMTLSKSSIPLLLLHGTADTFVPPAMMATNYAASTAKKKCQVAIPNAQHGMGSRVWGQRYWQLVDRFIGESRGGYAK